jgi:hypothetical protein
MGLKKEKSIIHVKDHPNDCLKNIADEHNSPATDIFSKSMFKNNGIQET